jgi:tRNA G37 N-methylase TrmD
MVDLKSEIGLSQRGLGVLLKQKPPIGSADELRSFKEGKSRHLPMPTGRLMSQSTGAQLANKKL